MTTLLHNDYLVHLIPHLNRSRIEIMLSHALLGRSRVISCHLREIGGYLITVGYIFYRGNNHVLIMNGDRAG